MNTDASVWLRKQVRLHNLHAFWLVVLSFATAMLVWYLGWYFFVLILLGLVTAVRGDIGSQMPGWISTVVVGLILALMIWGIIDHHRHRYASVSDRNIIGWHLIGEFLLLPMRLTFAIWGNFTALRRMNADEIDGAWELLMTIQRSGKAYLSALVLIEPNTSRLFKIVRTLQLIELIDLHRGEGDWFYTIRSTRMDELRKLLPSI